MHLLAGNYKLISKCLEEILQTTVTIDITYRTIHSPANENCRMGKAKLGNNFTTGSDIYAIPLITFSFGPIKPTKIKKYLEGGDIYYFLQNFYSKTLPFEADVETKLISENEIFPAMDGSFGIVGYSIKI